MSTIAVVTWLMRFRWDSQALVWPLNGTKMERYEPVFPECTSIFHEHARVAPHRELVQRRSLQVF